MATHPRPRVRALPRCLPAVLLCLTALVRAETPLHLGLLPAGPPAGDAKDQFPPVTAELVADVSAIRPGATFHLGVLLRIPPGWHVYWKDPGEAGMPTTVDFRLPDGYRAGELLWPLPKTFRQAGDILGYGYEEQVLLWVPVTAPITAAPGSEAELRADAAWFACKDRCVAGQAAPRLRLPVADASRPARRELFERWRRLLPVPAADCASPVEAVTVSGDIPAGQRSGRFTLEATWKAAPKAVEWFPAARDDIEVADVAVETTGQRTVVTFTVGLLLEPKAPSKILETVLAAVDAEGVRRGVQIAVPVRTPRAAPSPAVSSTSPRPAGCEATANQRRTP